MTTLFQELDQSGWWSIFSAARATWVMKAKASVKPPNSKARWRLPFSTDQPGSLANSEDICWSLSFVAPIGLPPADRFFGLVAENNIARKHPRKPSEET